ncbi:MAG: hypothetical protein V1913_15555 [Fibrobacterota bacterium]
MNIPLSQRLERLTAWFHRENDRPLLGFYLGPQYPLHLFQGCHRNLPDGVIKPENVVVADYLDDYERLYQCYENTGGDLVWANTPFFGLPWVEAALGCTVIADHQTGSTRSEPPAEFAEHPVVPEFSADNPWVKKMLEFIPALQEHSHGRYPVGVTLMRGISDLLSALYGGDKFVMRMFDNPDEVQAAAGRLTDFWIAFGKCMLDRVPLFHGGTGAFFYSVWCPGKTIWLQEDASALLSPDLYERFIFPCDQRIARAFEHSVIHLHPARFMPVDFLLESDINVIEIHVDKGGPSARQLFDTHLKVLARKPLMVWGDLTADDFDFIMGHLPPKGLLVNTAVDSSDQAQVYWDKFTNIFLKNR